CLADTYPFFGSMQPEILRRLGHRLTIATVSAIAAGLAAAIWCAVADDRPASAVAKPNRIQTALHLAVDKNLAYCREWLAAKDFKSLRQTADGIGILANV